MFRRIDSSQVENKSISWILDSTSLLVICAYVIPLMIIGYFGRYVRPFQDDFCTYADVHEFGILGTVYHEYQTWSGRSSYIFTLAVLQSLGKGFMTLVPALLIILLVLSLTSLLISIQRFIDRAPHILGSASLAVSMVFTLFKIHQTPGQIIWWDSGSVIYISPIVLQLLFIAILADGISRHERPALKRVVILGALSFFLSGFSEGQALLQIGLLSLLLIFAAVFTIAAITRYTRAILISISASLAFLMISATSPGHRMRGGSEFGNREIKATLLEALNWTNRFVTSERWSNNGMIFLSLFVVATFFGAVLWKGNLSGLPAISFGTSIILIVFTANFTYAFIAANVFIKIYSTGTNPTHRVMTPSYWLLIVDVAALGILFGTWLTKLKPFLVSHKYLRFAVSSVCLGILLISLVGGPASGAKYFLQMQPELATYVEMHDKRDELARALIQDGESRLELPIIPGRFREGDLREDSNGFVNRCMARYYGVEEVIGIPDES